MRNSIPRLVAAHLLALAGPALALDIKGLEVDKPVDCAQIKALEVRQGTFFPACENGNNRWVVHISFLSGKATMMLQQSAERRLLSVFVSEFDFSEALDALTIKWGMPKIERSEIKNRMGAAFDQVSARWMDGDVAMRLDKHGARIDKPSLILIGREALITNKKDVVEKALRNQGNI